MACETNADCADDLVCPPGNGPRYGRPRGTSVCELPDCRFRRRDLGCGFVGAACGLNCDDGLPCDDAGDCPGNETCATGRGPLTASEATDVCMPPACLDEPVATGCGTTTDLCGKCACTPTCATKHCGDDAADGCGGRCRELCGPREPGCTADADCGPLYKCDSQQCVFTRAELGASCRRDYECATPGAMCSALDGCILPRAAGEPCSYYTQCESRICNYEDGICLTLEGCL